MKLLASRTQDLADVSRMLGFAKEKELDKIRQIIKTYLPTAEEDLESLIILGKLEIRQLMLSLSLISTYFITIVIT